MRHLIDTTDISVAEVDQILNTALDIIANRQKYSEVLKGKKLATLFYEPSTRTRLSFTSAMMELGGNVLGFSDAASSSVSKGETVADTVRVIGCFADIIAMRHSKEGAPLVASHYSEVSHCVSFINSSASSGLRKPCTVASGTASLTAPINTFNALCSSSVAMICIFNLSFSESG